MGRNHLKRWSLLLCIDNSAIVCTITHNGRNLFWNSQNDDFLYILDILISNREERE